MRATTVLTIRGSADRGRVGVALEQGWVCGRLQGVLFSDTASSVARQQPITPPTPCTVA